ncbi:MAG: hypothetical protein M5U07_17925 [Xanthobacteraceae bacterium]|nr:hypothetical protein [Xanthobacteraceae bacterium]
MRRALELAELAVLAHGPGVVEDQSELELLDAPGDVGGRADLEGGHADELREDGRQAAVGGDAQREAAGLRAREHRVHVVGGDLRMLEQGREIGLGAGRDLLGRQGLRILREHQGGGVERGLHGGARRRGAAEIDRRAHHGEDRNRRDAEDRKCRRAFVPEEPGKQHDLVRLVFEWRNSARRDFDNRSRQSLRFS